MAIVFEVLNIFKAKDKVSGKFDRMGKNANKFGKKSEKAFKRASKAARGFGNITKGILTAGGIQKGLGLVSQGLSSVTTDFLNFDNAVLSASAKFKGLDLTTQAGIKTLQELKKTAREVGRDTEFNAAQAASGLDFLALAGFNAKQAMALLPGVTNLATVAQVDLATATDIASDSLGAFGLMTEDTEQLTKNFTRVQDVMAKTTATSNTSLIDLFEAVKKGAPDFTAAGQDIETFSTLIGAMANAGIKGSEAGTKLRNMAVRLAKPTKEAAEVMEEWGIRVQDGNGNFRDMIDILDDVKRGSAQYGEVARAAGLKVLFGARQTGGLTVLLNEGTEKLKAYRDMLRDSGGAAEQMAEIMRSSLLNRLKSLGSAATDVGFQLFSAFDEKGAGAIDTLTQFIRKIDLTPFIETIKTVSKFGGEMFDKFTAFGERTGLFDAIRQGMIDLKPHFDTVIDITKTLFKFFGDIGVFDAMVVGLKVAIATITTMTQLFGLLWRNVIKPIISGITAAVNLAKSISGLGGITGEDREKRDKDTVDIIEKQNRLFKEQRALRKAAREASGVSTSDRITAAFKTTRSDVDQKNFDIIAEVNRKFREKRAANQTALETNSRISGSIDVNFANAPAGTTATTTGNSAPAIRTNMLEFAVAQ